eukprot:TRINITY_DN24860_c0_g1_i2.p1 TRINITY_DN24860_c0_g1~~TRINITY_DN24860_c0_g1_i2.p1  ORF type:complete len:162 (-),score=32.37 TRINITY_DN24860_c0_g1_i2:17-466(-)
MGAQCAPIAPCLGDDHYKDTARLEVCAQKWLEQAMGAHGEEPAIVLACDHYPALESAGVCGGSGSLDPRPTIVSLFRPAGDDGDADASLSVVSDGYQEQQQDADDAAFEVVLPAGNCIAGKPVFHASDDMASVTNLTSVMRLLPSTSCR